VAVSFGQPRLDAVQPLGFEPLHHGFTRYFIKSLMAARDGFPQGGSPSPVKANVCGFGGHQFSRIF
jgi:hypothetical protein